MDDARARRSKLLTDLGRRSSSRSSFTTFRLPATARVGSRVERGVLEALRRAASWDLLRPCAVLEATVGSRAWGLANESSDTRKYSLAEIGRAFRLLDDAHASSPLPQRRPIAELEAWLLEMRRSSL